MHFPLSLSLSLMDVTCIQLMDLKETSFSVDITFTLGWKEKFISHSLYISFGAFCNVYCLNLSSTEMKKWKGETIEWSPSFIHSSSSFRIHKGEKEIERERDSRKVIDVSINGTITHCVKSSNVFSVKIKYGKGSNVDIEEMEYVEEEKMFKQITLHERGTISTLSYSSMICNLGWWQWWCPSTTHHHCSLSRTCLSYPAANHPKWCSLIYRPSPSAPPRTDRDKSLFPLPVNVMFRMGMDNKE